MKNILKMFLCLSFLLTPCFAFADVKTEKRAAKHYKYYYWKHPTWGFGYWTYPAPPVAFYYDDFGRLVPLGWMYDLFGNLVAIPKAYGYSYYYTLKKPPVWWNQHQHPKAQQKPELISPPKEHPKEVP